MESSPTLTPTCGKVLVRIDPEKTMVGSIHIPKELVQEAYSGKVVQVGGASTDKKGKRTPCPVQVGDQVLFRKWTGVELPQPWEGLLILKFEEIVAVLPEGMFAEYVKHPDVWDPSSVESEDAQFGAGSDPEADRMKGTVHREYDPS